MKNDESDFCLKISLTRTMSPSNIMLNFEIHTVQNLNFQNAGVSNFWILQTFEVEIF